MQYEFYSGYTTKLPKKVWIMTMRGWQRGKLLNARRGLVGVWEYLVEETGSGRVYAARWVTSDLVDPRHERKKRGKR